MPIDTGSPAIDQADCAPPGNEIDARGVDRPWDFPAIPDAAGGCDIGSYEAVDEDGDGVDDVLAAVRLFGDGFESGDIDSWTSGL